ncbi:MAG: DUF6232 family protein [Anaerolineae bacterium]
MRETIYYSRDGVVVTSARFVANGRTYPLSELASVTSGRKPVGFIPWFLSLLGAVIILGGLIVAGLYIFIATELGPAGLGLALVFGGLGLLGAIAGAGFLAAGVKRARRRRRTYVVQVTTAAGGTVKVEYGREEDAREAERAVRRAMGEMGAATA